MSMAMERRKYSNLCPCLCALDEAFIPFAHDFSFEDSVLGYPFESLCCFAMCIVLQ